MRPWRASISAKCRGDLVDVADMAGERRGLAAGRADFRGDRLATIDLAAAHDYGRPMAREQHARSRGRCRGLRR